jgi:hypothetical protein
MEQLIKIIGINEKNGREMLWVKILVEV